MKNPSFYHHSGSPGDSFGGNQVVSPPITNPLLISTPVRRLPAAPEPPATRAPPPVTVAPPPLTTSQASLTFQGGSESKSAGDGDEIVVRIITVNDVKTQLANGGMFVHCAYSIVL